MLSNGGTVGRIHLQKRGKKVRDKMGKSLTIIAFLVFTSESEMTRVDTSKNNELITDFSLHGNLFTITFSLSSTSFDIFLKHKWWRIVSDPCLFLLSRFLLTGAFLTKTVLLWPYICHSDFPFLTLRSEEMIRCFPLCPITSQCDSHKSCWIEANI